MNVTLDLPDEVIRAIAQAVAAELRPHLATRPKEEDAILDVKALAAYLGVTQQRIYEAANLNTIPFFRVGKYLRFKKSAIGKWIDSQAVPAVGKGPRILRAVKGGA